MPHRWPGPPASTTFCFNFLFDRMDLPSHLWVWLWSSHQVWSTLDTTASTVRAGFPLHLTNFWIYLGNVVASVSVSVVLVEVSTVWSSTIGAYVSPFGATLIFAWRASEPAHYLWYAKNLNEEGVGDLCWPLSWVTTDRCSMISATASATCEGASWRGMEREACNSELSCHKVPRT